MIKNYFVFTKEIGQLLIKYRKQARLSQGEVAKRCGLHTKTGYSQISRLESGRIKNPSLGSIILFLKACNTPLVSFFQELSAIDFKIEHEKIMRQVEMPSGNWSVPETISTPEGVKFFPIAVADRNSNVHFIWTDDFNFTRVTYAYRVRYASGSWSAIEPCSSFINRLPSGKDFALGPNDIANSTLKCNIMGSDF